MFEAQEAMRTAEPQAVANKWHVWRHLAEIKDRIGIADRALAVLHALLSFYPETVLSGPDLVVFPSNAELRLRAHGMAESTLRTHLAWLVGAKLILRRDSPNGKRYAHRGEGGEVTQAYGFDLSPLRAGATYFARIAVEVRAERLAIALLREKITILRRDIAKSIEAGLEEGLPAPWEDYTLVLARHSQGLLRKLDRDGLEARANALHELLIEVRKSLELISGKTGGNDAGSERHNQNSKPESRIEPESRECRPEGYAQADGESAAPVARGSADNARLAPLGLVLQACPDVVDYSPSPISTWRDLLDVADLVRQVLRISPSAWTDAREVLGDNTAATCLAAILQKGETVKSPGGYLGALVEKAKDREFSPVPMLMALLRARGR